MLFHRLLCAILRVRVRRFGAPSPATARLIVSNHVSWLDIPVLGALEPMTFLAKRQIGRPFLGRQLALLQGVVFVDRERKRCIPDVNRAMARRMAGGEPVALFAEATTGDGNRLLRFRSSHFEAARAAGAGAVAQPVFLHYCQIGAFPVTRADRPRIAWYGDMTFLPHLWRVLFAGAIVCEVHYGDPLPVAAAPDRKALARQTERAMRSLAERARGRAVVAGRADTPPRRHAVFTLPAELPAEPKTG